MAKGEIINKKYYFAYLQSPLVTFNYDVQGLKSMHYDMLTLKENLSITTVCCLCTIVGPCTYIVCLQLNVPFNDFNYIQNFQNFTLQIF